MTKETADSSPSPLLRPALFEAYFGMGRGDAVSPFLTSQARLWGVNLSLKASLFAASLLLTAFFLYSQQATSALGAICLVGVYFLAGTPSLIDAIEDLANVDINIDVLMTLAAFSSVLIGSPLEGGLLLVLFSLSGSIEDTVTAKARSSLQHLQKLSPSKATIIDEEGRPIEKSIRDIKIGTQILVRSGEVVPLDGVVIEGISSVNLVHLTGESLPIKKEKGDEVPAGARNLEGSLTLKATRTSSESTLTKIIEMVVQAQEAKPSLQRWFDRLSRSYALTIIFCSFLAALSFPYLFHIPFLGFEGSIYRAVAFLIAASPCALILALPIAYLSALSACAREGILLKGGTVLDQLASCSIIAFDKTGTLTTGQLVCKKIEFIGNSALSEQTALSVAYGLEKNVVHPIAQAVLAHAEREGVRPIAVSQVLSVPGYGVSASVSLDGKDYSAFMGHPSYIQPHLSQDQLGILEQKILGLQQEGRLVAVLLIGESLFLFSFEDQIRTGVAATIQRLKKAGHWKLLMLSGDHEANARRVAKELDIQDVQADLRPEDKLLAIAAMSEHHNLAMVGDGVNDAPSLARATVGICMGQVGSGMAVDAAEVILLHDNLERLDWLMEKAKKTETIVRQNLMIAGGAILIASVPALAGWVPLWLAVILHEGGTVLVGLNALRLLR